MIDESELYRRFEQVVPGTSTVESANDNLFSDFNVYFERLSMTGLEEMHRYSSDKRLYEFFEFEPFDSIDKTKEYIEKLLQRMGNNPLKRTAMYWFVRRKKDNYLVGTASLGNLNYCRKSVEWGYGIDPKQWGSGAIMQIQEILKHYVFDVLQLNRLYGSTILENKRTISSLLASGMRHEGTLRQHYCKGSIFHDAWQYAMLRQDYVQLKNKIKGKATRHNYSEEDVIELIASVLTDDEINAQSNIENIPSWDSMNHMLIIIALSEKLAVSLSPSEITHATSVKAIAAILAERGNN